MLELMNKHKKVNRYMWAVLIATFLIFLLKLTPDVLAAFGDLWLKIHR